MADDYVVNLLEEWELQELIEIFKEQGIDQDAFMILDQTVIKELIGKVGLRLKFDLQSGSISPNGLWRWAHFLMVQVRYFT